MKKRILAACAAALMALLSVCSALPVSAEVKQPAARHETPTGYNDHDYQKMVAFLDIEDENSTKNGEKLSSSYDPSDPSTWVSSSSNWISWQEFDGELHLFDIYLRDYDLRGCLDVADCSGLEELGCYDCSINSLNASDCGSLARLNCQNNGLEMLNISGCSALEVLECQFNSLTAIDLSCKPELWYLDCRFNSLSEIDVSGLEQLWYFDCSNNQLSELNVENNTELNYFSCAVNHISELDVSNNTALEEFWCSSNALSEINVSCNTALKTFGCVLNNISELDVSNNTRLENLYCAYNLLTELDLSNNPNFFFDHIRAEGSGTIGLRGKWALAIPNEGASFLGWYTEGGDLITDYWNDISQNDTDSTRVVACFGDADPVAGDADGSGAVDTTDALYVLRCALGISGNAEEMLLNCDIDGNGMIDTTDALIILRMALGIID